MKSFPYIIQPVIITHTTKQDTSYVFGSLKVTNISLLLFLITSCQQVHRYSNFEHDGVGNLPTLRLRHFHL